MKRNRDCRSDMQLVPEQPFVLQGKTGRQTYSFKCECQKTEALGCGKRQEQYNLGKIPRCVIGFLCTQLLRAAPLRLYLPLLLLSTDTGKHSAREQTVSCRDRSCHCCTCFGRVPLHCTFPLWVAKDFQDRGEFLIRGFNTLHLQRKVLNCRNTELLSINNVNSQNHFFLLFYCIDQQNKLEWSSGDHMVNSLSSSCWANFKDGLMLFTALSSFCCLQNGDSTTSFHPCSSAQLHGNGISLHP